MNTEACNLHLQTKTATQYLGHRRKCSFLLIFNCRCIRSRHDSRYFSCCVLYSFIMSTNLVRSVPCYYTSYRKKLFTVQQILYKPKLQNSKIKITAKLQSLLHLNLSITRFKCISRANLVLVNKFCYLGDMLSVDGDGDAAVETRIRTASNTDTTWPSYSLLQYLLSFSCLLYTSPSPRDRTRSRMPSSA